MRVGIAGTGRMGAAIAARLAGLGHEVQVWNRTAARGRALAFPVVETAGKLPAQSEVIITLLADGTAVKAVYAQLRAPPWRLRSICRSWFTSTR